MLMSLDSGAAINVDLPIGQITIMQSSDGACVELIECPQFEVGMYSIGTDVDGIILCSFINTMLRDGYKSLDAFCDANEADKNEIIEKLTAAGFE